MRLVKRGNIEKVWKGKCRRCGAEWEAEIKELEEIQVDERENVLFSTWNPWRSNSAHNAHKN